MYWSPSQDNKTERKKCRSNLHNLSKDLLVHENYLLKKQMTHWILTKSNFFSLHVAIRKNKRQVTN